MAGIALLDRRHVLIQDEIEAIRPVEVVWNFHTRAHIEIHGGRASLSSGSSRIELQIVSPRGAQLRVGERQPAAAPGTAAGRREPDRPLDRDARCSPGGWDHAREQ